MKWVIRFLRALFTWKMAGRLLFALACLATLGALVVIEENWRAKRDWEAYLSDRSAKGRPVALHPLTPPPVPDDQNFALTPLLKPIYENIATDPHNMDGEAYASRLTKKIGFPNADGKHAPRFTDGPEDVVPYDAVAWKDFLGEDPHAWLQKREAEMVEISTAVRERTGSRFGAAFERGVSMNSPHLGVLRAFAKNFTLRALLELQDGQADAALADTITALRIGDSLKNEPSLISLMMRLAIYQTALSATWEGLHERRWNETQLAELQGELARIDLPAGYLLAMQGERAAINDILLQTIRQPELLAGLTYPGNPALRYLPQAAIYRNLIAFNKEHDTTIERSIDPVAHRVDPRIFDRLGLFVSFSEPRWRVMLANPYSWMMKMAFSVLTTNEKLMAETQSRADFSTIACALERYRLANGSYPDVLGKLSPGFIRQIPNDLVSGGAIHFETSADGGYVLSSSPWHDGDRGPGWRMPAGR